jgi:hypothetical protein
MLFMVLIVLISRIDFRMSEQRRQEFLKDFLIRIPHCFIILKLHCFFINSNIINIQGLRESSTYY